MCIRDRGFFAPEYLPRLRALARKLPSPLPGQLTKALSTPTQEKSKQAMTAALNKYLQEHGYRITYRKTTTVKMEG